MSGIIHQKQDPNAIRATGTLEKRSPGDQAVQVLLYVLIALIALLCVLPFIYVIAGSFATEQELTERPLLPDSSRILPQCVLLHPQGRLGFPRPQELLPGHHRGYADQHVRILHAGLPAFAQLSQGPQRLHQHGHRDHAVLRRHGAQLHPGHEHPGPRQHLLGPVAARCHERIQYDHHQELLPGTAQRTGGGRHHRRFQ